MATLPCTLTSPDRWFIERPLARCTSTALVMGAEVGDEVDAEVDSEVDAEVDAGVTNAVGVAQPHRCNTLQSAAVI